MSGLKESVLSGFNEFLAQQQRQPGSMMLTLAQFNSEKPFDVRLRAQDVHRVVPLTSFEPSGSTPLYDALVQLIEHAQSVERSTQREIVVAVFTDGKENASRRYSREQVFRMIEQRREQGWTFVFLGANQDSFASAGSLAMSRGATSNYVADAKGVRASWADLSGSTTRARKVLRSGRAQTSTERAEFLKGFNSAEEDYERRKGRGRGLRHGGGTSSQRERTHSHGGRWHARKRRAEAAAATTGRDS